MNAFIKYQYSTLLCVIGGRVDDFKKFQYAYTSAYSQCQNSGPINNTTFLCVYLYNKYKFLCLMEGVYSIFTRQSIFISVTISPRLRSQLERSPRLWKVGCSNPSCDRPKLLKQVVTALLLNARQQVRVSRVLGYDHN